MHKLVVRFFVLKLACLLTKNLNVFNTLFSLKVSFYLFNSAESSLLVRNYVNVQAQPLKANSHETQNGRRKS